LPVIKPVLKGVNTPTALIPLAKALGGCKRKTKKDELSELMKTWSSLISLCEKSVVCMDLLCIPLPSTNEKKHNTHLCGTSLSHDNL
jgi:hypothetical protein